VRDRVATRLAFLLLAAALLASLPPVAAGADAVPAFEAVRERLRVQVRAADDPVAPDALSRTDLPGTRTVLVRLPVGAPEGAEVEPREVTAAEAAAWPVQPEALFETGLANLERRQPPQVRESDPLLSPARITLLYGDHPFGSSYALSVRSYPRCNGRHGALVAVPNRHATLCHPIDSALAREALPLIAMMALQIAEEGESPVTRDLFWIHEDGLETLPVTVTDGVPRLTTPDAFDAMMRELLRAGRPAPQDRRWR
jgi:hypothetical protein